MVYVAAGLVYIDGKILMLELSEQNQKSWTVPTGVRHEDESAIDNCIRVVYEQTGLRVKVEKKLFEKQGDDLLIEYFYCTYESGQLNLFNDSDIITNIDWISEVELYTLNLKYPEDLELIKEYLELFCLKSRFYALKDEVSSCNLSTTNEIKTYLDHHYEAYQPLSGGRLNKVYKARKGEEIEVVKTCKGAYRTTELRREAFAMKHVKSNHIPKILQYFEEECIPFLVQEYIEGHAIRELEPNHSTEELMAYWYKVGEALKEIHEVRVEQNYDWLEEMLELAKVNIDANLLDPIEFIDDDYISLLGWLQDNRPDEDETTVIHGDLRSKNIFVDQQGDIKFIDWGFVDVGNPYYDLAILDYYFTKSEYRQAFYQGYQIRSYEKDLIHYFEKLSKFINV